MTLSSQHAPTPPATPRIGVLLSRRDPFQQGLLRGVLRSSLGEHLHRYESLVRHSSELNPNMFDGLIGCFYDPTLAGRVREVGLPAVNLSATVSGIDLPAVWVDNAAVGAMAGEHLLERGFWRFGYVGYSSRLFSQRRREGFASYIEGRGHAVAYHDASTGEDRTASLTAWLISLGQPVGVLCASDELAQRVLAACRELELAVPEAVAVMGVDDDETLCGFYPGLTSIRLPLEPLGLLGADLLARLIRGEPTPEEPLLLPPAGLTVRGSTDIVASGDPHVARALRFIRQHACSGINVGDVMDAVPISRREFEKSCKSLLGRTPLGQIHHVRMNEAKRLLTQTDLPIGEVSQRCGFNNVHYLGRWFGKAEGCTPSEYRTRHRAAGASDV